MFKSKLVLSSFAILIIICYFVVTPKVATKPPIPTEIIQKKKDKKLFKNQRKSWIANMHRSAPDLDWKSLDKINRAKKTKKIEEERKILLNKGSLNLENPNRHIVINRDIEGTWNEKGSNNLSGRILTSDIDFDNNLIYCASDGGNIWKGSLEGENWQSLNDYMQIKNINMLKNINHNEGKRLLISSSDKFLYTDNDGITFSQSDGLDFLDDWGWINRSVVQSDTYNTIYILSVESGNNGGANSSIYKSINHGESFEKIITLDSNNGFGALQNYNEFDMWTLDYFYSDIYLLHNNEFYIVDQDGNLNFVSNIPTSETGENVLTGGQNINNPFLYARVNNEIYYSMNGGVSWLYKNPPPQWIFTKNSFNASLINPSLVFWGGIEAFKSFDSGFNWELVNNWWDYYDDPASKLHADIPEIKCFLNNDFQEVYLISTDGGIYVSYDMLDSVNNLSFSGLGVSQYYSTLTKSSYPYSIYAGSQDQGFQRSINDNGGILNFEQSISGDYGHLVSGDGGNTLWCNYPGFSMLYRNPNEDTNGLTLDFPGSGHLWLAPLMVDPLSPMSAYLGGGGINGGNHLIKLTYFNNSIISTENPYNFNSTISALSFSNFDSNTRYVLTENGYFYYSTDGGNGWNQSNTSTGLEPQYFYGSTIYSLNNTDEVVLIGGSGYSNPPIYISYNNGETFNSFSEGMPNTLVYDLCGTDDDNILFAATELGPYIYSEIQGEWAYMGGIHAPDQVYWSCEYISEINTIRFGTYGRGIWDFVLDTDYNINYGDVNQDNNINIQDIIIIIGFIIDELSPNNNEFLVSDINQDGLINVLDIVLIVDIIFD